MSEANNAPAPAPAPAGAPAPAPAPAGHGIAWLPTDVDPDTLGHVQNKQWQSPADAVKSHRELEKLFGADRAGRTVTLPTDPNAPEWSGVWEKLGKPKGPDGYGIKPAEGADPAFSKAAADIFHKANLTAAQAQMLAGWYAEVGKTQGELATAAEQEALRQEHEALAKDWGTGPDAAARRELARRAMTHLGLDEAAVDALEKVAGYSKTLKALAKVGDMLREAGAEGINAVGSFGTTPEGARVRRQQLMADAGWRAKAMVPNSAEWAELQKLDKILVDSMSRAA